MKPTRFLFVRWDIGTNIYNNLSKIVGSLRTASRTRYVQRAAAKVSVYDYSIKLKMAFMLHLARMPVDNLNVSSIYQLLPRSFTNRSSCTIAFPIFRCGEAYFSMHRNSSIRKQFYLHGRCYLQWLVRSWFWWSFGHYSYGWRDPQKLH